MRAALPRIFRWLSALLFALSLLGIGVMFLSDATNHLRPTPIHQHAAALPLIGIGLSYIALQLSARRPWGELIKGLFLGLAFVLWGAEQLLLPSRLTIVMDGLVVTIFVVDLGLMILEHLKRHDHELP